jgi:Flp pilus assembly protein TadG
MIRISKKSSRFSARRWRGGGALIESILVMPLVISLGFGVIDFSYYFFLKNALQGAALAGVRAAIPSTATNSNVTSVISTMLGGAGISSYTVTTSPTSVSGLAATTNITVTVTASWGTIGTHMLSASFGGIANTKQIVGSAVMQKEP